MARSTLVGIDVLAGDTLWRQGIGNSPEMFKRDVAER
jgi:hypothetical protein